ncbi:hypothetical protein QU577_02885 [Priestia megaterium]|uniref:hypothetical protein n=1 Tax=Priestia megaterium TaxID=1404 RepID=UPI0025B15E3A|nr:hypothetical protein [Priestia megaterium]MDN3360698.1 hypothetical protein [Priestia megaterium]
MSDQERQIQALHGQIEDLKEEMYQMKLDISALEKEKGKPVLTPALVGQIGGFVLGGLAIIGILWM